MRGASGSDRACTICAPATAGLYIFIQVHIELDPDMPLTRAHAVSDAVERELCAAFPQAEVIIHQDPAGLEAGIRRPLAATAGNSARSRPMMRDA